jgi:hypothetical protein
MGLVVHRLLGMVLVAAAAVKGMPAGEADLLLISPWLTAIVIGGELLLGIWLITGTRPAVARWVAIIAFLCFATVSGGKAIQGAESCGCLGPRLVVNPLVALAFNAGALGALWWWPVRPILGKGVSPAAHGNRATAYAYFGAATGALIFSVYAGSELLTSLAPSKLVVLGPARIAVTHLDRRQPVEVTFHLQNPTSRVIGVQKVRTDCPRASVAFQHANLQPGEETSLVVRINSFDETQTAFVHRILVDTNTGSLALFVEGTLPVSQTLFFRPRALVVKRDEGGNWPTRTITVRVPIAYCNDGPKISVHLSGCGDSSYSVSNSGQTEYHYDYTIQFTPSPSLGSGWNGGVINVHTGCGELKIPVTVENPPVDWGSL